MIVFVWNNIKNFLCKNTLMFTLFVLVFFVTNISVFYTYNFFLQITDMQEFYEDEARSYSMEWRGADVQGPGLEKRLSAFCEEVDVPLKRIYLQRLHENGKDILLADYLGNKSAEIKVYYGNYLTADSLYETVAPRSSNYKIDDTFIIGGHVFKIIGINTDEAFEIPIAVWDWDAHAKVTIVTPDELSKNQEQHFTEAIRHIFNVETVALPAERAENRNLFMEFFVIILLLCLTLINVAYIYSSLLEKRKSQCRILRMLGCGRLRCTCIYLLELWMLSTVIYALAALVFDKVIMAAMVQCSDFYYHVLTLPSYLVIYVLMEVFIFLLNAANLHKAVRL